MSLVENAKQTATEVANDPTVAGWVGKLMAGSSFLALIADNASNILIPIGLLLGIFVSGLALRNQRLLYKKMSVELETARLKNKEAKQEVDDE